MPNRKHEAAGEDRRPAGGEPAADPAHDAARMPAPRGGRARGGRGVVIEDVDPDEPDPGKPPRAPI